MMGVWLGHETNTIKLHVLKRFDYIYVLSITTHVNNGHDWEDECIHLRTQQTCISKKYN